MWLLAIVLASAAAIGLPVVAQDAATRRRAPAPSHAAAPRIAPPPASQAAPRLNTRGTGGFKDRAATAAQTTADPAAKSLDSPAWPFEVLHMQLDVRFTNEDIQARRMNAAVTYRLRVRPLPDGAAEGASKGGSAAVIPSTGAPASAAAAVSILPLNAVNLEIRSVQLLPSPPASPVNAKSARHPEGTAPAGTPLEFDSTDDVLNIRLDRAYGTSAELAVRIDYSVQSPHKGLYFVLPDDDHPDRPRTVYTMSEPLMARYWLPCHDWPDTRWPSDVYISVPPPLSAVSVGAPVTDEPETPAANSIENRKSKIENQADDLRTSHWRLATPVDPHLLGFAVGEFVTVASEGRGRPVRAYLPPAYENAGRFGLRRVPAMLEYYTTRLGVDFPFPQYAHAGVVNHFHGGMEHAGFSMVDPTPLATGEYDDASGWWTEFAVVAHMLGHEWFAGLVNYRDIREAWLNESFGTYLHECCRAHFEGPELLDERIWELTLDVGRSDVAGRDRPLLRDDLATAEEVYNYDGAKVYWKGAAVLHMLRHQLGEEAFWRGVREYLEQHAGGSVTTDDLRAAFENAAHCDLRAFFAQWVRRAGLPRLQITYEWLPAQRCAAVTVRQCQTIDEAHPAFEFPLDLAILPMGVAAQKSAGDAWRTETVVVNSAAQSFTLRSESEPELFCVEPRGGLLAARQESKPEAMWRAQVRRGPTALARLQAVEHVGRMRDVSAVPALCEAVCDPNEYWGARIRAARALARLGSREALAGLLQAARAENSRPELRAALVEALGHWAASAEACASVVEALRRGPYASVQVAALGALPRFAREIREPATLLVVQRAVPPTNRAVRAAALGALSSMDAGTALAALLATDASDPNDPIELRRQLISAVQHLAEAVPPQRPRAGEFLLRQLDDPRPGLRSAAVEALGAVGDERVLAALRGLPDDEKPKVRTAVRKALEDIERRLMATPP